MDDPKKLPCREIAFLALIYTIMHGGIFLASDSVFWDDWILFRSSPATILRIFNEAGVIFNWVGHLHVFMLSLGIWSYKLLTFALMLGAGLLLNLILRRNAILPNGTRVLIVIFFLILPLNFARIAAIDFPYALCYFLFFLGWLVIDRSRILAFIFFTISFNTPSLLVFYTLPILDLFFRKHGAPTLSKYALAARLVFNRFELIILPFAFYFIKSRFFKPFGDYEGYNQNFKLENIFNAAKHQLLDVVNIQINWILAIIIFPLVLFFLYRQFSTDKWKELSPGLAKSLFIFGAISFFLGAVPYWILDLIPTFNEWASRHQLLLPLGTSFIIVASIFLLPENFRVLASSAVVAVSLSVGLTTYYDFKIDWEKQKSLVALFAQSEDIRQADIVLFQDSTLALNAIRREYRFYEWNGLLEYAFDSQNRFGLSADKFNWYFEEPTARFFSYAYKAGMHKAKEKPSIVLVKIGQPPSSCSGPCILSRLHPAIDLSATPVQLVRADGNP